MQKNNLKRKYRVGICGHRDLFSLEINEYKKEIIDIFGKLINRHPNNEIFVVTSLAEGADRLIVECAISLGLRYEVVLPMDATLYKKDFDEISKKEFNNFFLSAAGSFIIPLVEDNTFEQIMQQGEQRDRQYQFAGKEVVGRSNHMIFLYDGVDNSFIGGTADIFQYANHINKSYDVIKCKRENKGEIT